MSLRTDIKKVLRVVDRCNLDISADVIRILVLAEDRRYFFHLGVDPWALARAAFKRVSMGRIEGASTIEAQLFRTVSNRREVSLRRKFREMIGAVIVSVLRPKDRIARAYLRCAYFGFRRPGIRHATKALGYDLSALTLGETCELVARLKRPARLGLNEGCLQLRLLRERAVWLQQKLSKHQSIQEINLARAELPLPIATRPKA